VVVAVVLTLEIPCQLTIQEKMVVLVVEHQVEQDLAAPQLLGRAAMVVLAVGLVLVVLVVVVKMPLVLLVFSQAERMSVALVGLEKIFQFGLRLLPQVPQALMLVAVVVPDKLFLVLVVLVGVVPVIALLRRLKMVSLTLVVVVVQLGELV
jgi:hypothetical protein